MSTVSGSVRVSRRFFKLGSVCRISSALRFRSVISCQKSRESAKNVRHRTDHTISMSLLSRKTAYSNLYVSTPLENKGNL